LKNSWKEISKPEIVNPTHYDLNAVPTKIVADDPIFKPKYKSRGAACCDLVANIPEGSVRLIPGSTVVVDCGFRMQLRPGYEALVRPRTSLAKKSIIITNSPGTIDDDFRGRVRCIMSNIGHDIVEIKHLDRVAQMALKPVWYFAWEDCQEDDLDATERGDGMFGSTGSSEPQGVK
jgi:dUTP pyrophosphatase